MTYNYRTGTDRIKPYLNDLNNNIENLRTQLKEFAYHFGLLEAPEVNWTMALPTPSEVSK